MADEDKKDKAAPESTQSKAGSPKKAAVKKKTAKKKATKKKASKKAVAAAATTKPDKAEPQVKVSETPVEAGGKGDESGSAAKPATAGAAPATGSQSRKFDFILAFLLIIFLVASIIILRDEKAREGATGQQQGILQTIRDAFGNKKAATASLPQKTMESAALHGNKPEEVTPGQKPEGQQTMQGASEPRMADRVTTPPEATPSDSPVAAPGVTKDALAPATVGPAGTEGAAAETAPQVTPGYRTAPEQQPRMSDAPAAASVTSTASEPPADVAPVSEPRVNIAPLPEPPVVSPAETEVPVAKVSEPAQPRAQVLEEPAQAVVTEPVIEQPAAAPPATRRGYNPYSRHPYAYPRGYGRDYDRSYDWGYDRSYPGRPPQRWSW